MDVSGYSLITGAASGIGAATAKGFAHEGARGLALLDINASGLAAIKGEAEAIKPGLQVLTYVVNVSEEAMVDDAVSSAAKQFGRLDYVVNAAGIPFKHAGGAAEAKTSDWSRVLDINLNGTFYILRAAARIMLQQTPINSTIDGRELQRGSIINIASIMGVVGVAESTSYTAAKHAVIGLTRTSSDDYAARGLRINAICPGYIDTPLTHATSEIERVMNEKIEKHVPMHRAGRAEEIADAVLFLAGGRSSFVTGSAMVVDGGYTQR